MVCLMLEGFYFLFERAVCIFSSAPNGWRYPLVGGIRQRPFAGTNLKPRKVLENAQTPTSRVHAVLGCFMVAKAKVFSPVSANLKSKYPFHEQKNCYT
jgi:hypothetical protein